MLREMKRMGEEWVCLQDTQKVEREPFDLYLICLLSHLPRLASYPVIIVHRPHYPILMSMISIPLFASEFTFRKAHPPPLCKTG